VPSPNQAPDPPITLEEISKHLSELDGKIASLTVTYSGLAVELAAQQKQFLESIKGKSQSNKSAWIVPAATLAAAVIAALGSIYSGWNTSQTNAALARLTTLQSENAKKDLETYYAAQGKIAKLEQDFETFLVEKQLSRRNDAHELGNDLDGMCIAQRFGPRTPIVKEYNDFIFEKISGLQRNPESWKDVDALREEAKGKCQKAIDALNALEQNK
jgi:hypothetical protein